MAARSSARQVKNSSKSRTRVPELKTEVQQFKRRRILEQSRELFYAQGYEATTLDTIASSLNVTKPFVYSYFKNKSEILTAICEIAIGSCLAVLDELFAARLPPGDKLRRLIERLTATVIENQKCLVVWRREEMNLEPGEAARLMDMRGEFDRKLGLLIEDGRKKGEFSTEFPEFTAVAITGLLSSVAVWYRPTGTLSQTDVAMRLIATIERMVGRKSSD